MGKRRYNSLANLGGFVNLTNKKRKTSNLKGNSNTINLTPSRIHATQAGSDSEKENVSGKFIRLNLLTQS